MTYPSLAPQGFTLKGSFLETTYRQVSFLSTFTISIFSLVDLDHSYLSDYDTARLLSTMFATVFYLLPLFFASPLPLLLSFFSYLIFYMIPFYPLLSVSIILVLMLTVML